MVNTTEVKVDIIFVYLSFDNRRNFIIKGNGLSVDSFKIKTNTV